MYRGVRSTRTPGPSLSIRNSVGARSGSTRASTIRKSATSPTVTNHFSPSIRKPPPTRSAVVAISEGSEPAPSSVTAKQSRRSPRIAGSRYCSRWAGVQARSALAGRQTVSHSALVSCPSSSCTSTWSRTLRPWPLHSAGMLIAFRACSRTSSAIRVCASASRPFPSSQLSSSSMMPAATARARARSSSWAALSVRSTVTPGSYNATSVRMMNETAGEVNGPSRVQSVQRAVGLLKGVADSAAPPTAAELAERCGLNRTTAWRILQTLEDEGILDRDPVSNRYSAGYELTRMAANTDESLLRLARPHLVELSSQTGETVSLAVPRGHELVYVEQIQAPHVMAADWLGRAVPLHGTSTGKALLAWLPASVIDDRLAEPLPSFTEATITDPASLGEELDEVRRLGYAVSRGELEASLWGVSAAVLDGGRRPIAVVSVWGAERRVQGSGVEALGEATAATAATLALATS